MTTKIITSTRPVVQAKGYDYTVSSMELLTMEHRSESAIRRMVERDVNIPEEAICTRTENKKNQTFLFRWTWFEITIKDN